MAGNAYSYLFPSLASKGIEVYGFDQRGWGRSVTSPSSRGLTGPTSTVISDISEVLEHIINEKPNGAPLFMMGHSMGGAEVLTYAAKGPASLRKQLRGYLAEAPFLALHPSGQPSKLLVSVGRLAAKVLPHMQTEQKLDANIVSRDPEVAKAFAEDKLCHDIGTLEGIAGMLDRGEQLLNGSIKVLEDVGKVSLWVGHGTGDLITSHEASKMWVDVLDIKDKTIVLYEGFYHKLHAEPGEDKVLFADDIAEWILKRSEGVSSDFNASKL
ncbi:MAG: hypothetical protein M1829_005304 [Trizodia sp. TS-e1964]|nr:MAG: hypothetical protein M1829_005304 [Trizodia sp. TS-e1964]